MGQQSAIWPLRSLSRPSAGRRGLHVKGHVKTKHIHFGDAADDRDDLVRVRRRRQET